MEEREGKHWTMEGGGKSWREGRDGGGGTCEAHSPGLVVARVRSWVLAVVRGRSSLFAGVRFRSRAFVFVSACSSSWAGGGVVDAVWW